jgi:signal transduction histidine kinase
VDAAYRAEILVNETRTELKGSLLAWVCLTAVTVYLALSFWSVAPRPGLYVWLVPMAVFLTGWMVAWTSFIARPPPDEEILKRWVPGAKAGMTLCNLATAASVWVFLPVSGPEQRAFMIVLYAWYLIIQFAAASEATQVLRSAVVMVLGSLCAWLLVERPPYGVTLALLLPLFGATLIAIRRFVRQAVVEATAARAAAEAARREADLALAAVARERDAKTQFIRAASHDLQQPLQAAALFLDGLKAGGRKAEQAPAIGGVRQSLTAARALVGSMLENLKLEGGVIRAKAEPLTAGALFERVLLTQQPAADAAGVTLRTVGGGLPLTADPALLARAVENLVANAIRHSGGRRVLIGARLQAGATWLWVVDDGRGLGAGDEARIFAPFEQGGHVGPSGGFGLGLASTRGLVALMDGSCGVRTGMKRGAAFYIRLPALNPVIEEVRCAA